MGPFSCPGHCRVGDHLDSRRARSHAGGFGRPCLEGKPGASVLRFRGWVGRQRLPSGRGGRRAVFRLADRPARTQEAVLHHHRRLPHRDRAHRARLERILLLPVSFLHRLRHRRRVFRHQFDHPGAGPGALPRPTRSHHQRQFLGRGRARRCGRCRAAQPGAHPCRVGMAARVPDRRYSRPRRLFHAHVDSRKSALACDPRAGEGGRGRRQGHRTAISGRGREARAGPRRQSHSPALARPYAA